MRLLRSSKIVLAGSLLISQSQAVSTAVNLGYSTYQGTSLGNGVNQYLGMRFAAPPLGNLRFTLPQDPGNTTGVQDASQHGPLCLAVGGGGQSEDCLFIDVYAPTNATATSKLPVMVWITGGGYTQEANANYNGTSLVQASGYDIIVVNFNYRVGAFGFLASQKVVASGHLNAGLFDQRKALQWVQSHISQFGGNPRHVVIEGDSAGAGSVALHLTAFGGRNDNLFVGAIGDSVFFPYIPQVSEYEYQFTDFAVMAGCGSASDQMSCLRNQTTATLQAANIGYQYPGTTGAPLFPWGPVVGGSGDFIETYPYQQFLSGNFVNVPILFGNDNDEGSVFAPNANTPADIESFFVNNYPHLTPANTSAIIQQYPQTAPVVNHNAWFGAAANAYGETTFTCPGNMISASYAKKSAKVWNYRYDVQDPANTAAGIGVPHVWQMYAVWGPNGTPNFAGTAYTTTNAAIVPVVMQYWISFIKHLNPSTGRLAGTPAWNPFGAAQNRLLFVSNGTVMETVPQDQQQRCEFWQGLATIIEH